MKKFYGRMSLIVGIVFVAAVVFGITACETDQGTTDSRTANYEGTDRAGNTYTLTITENTARAAYAGAEGDGYVLVIKMKDGTIKTSRGVIKNINSIDGTLTLQPSVENSDTFSITISDEEISSVVGNIAVGEEDVITPRTFDTIYLRAGRWKNHLNETGENFTTNIFLYDFFDGTLTDATYKIRIQGTVDTELAHFKLQLFNTKFVSLGIMSETINIPSGPIDHEFTLKIDTKDLNKDDEIIVQLEEFLSMKSSTWETTYGKIPDEYPNGTIMATIRNFSISVVE